MRAGRPGAGAQAPQGLHQYLTLSLGGEAYAIDILRVQEIRSYETPTRIVNAPDFVRGVINLRGEIVPIMDMRLKLHLPPQEYTALTVVVVLRAGGLLVGIVVDSVSDVVSLSPESIRPAPQFESSMDSRFVTGLARMEDRMLIVVDMDALLSRSELGLVEGALSA
ncbi:MAG: chemotaxis protein CheW [Rhodoferax sp.]|nr:chemotaxis protein CheW [Rhodoferax sp.]